MISVNSKQQMMQIILLCIWWRLVQIGLVWKCLIPIMLINFSVYCSSYHGYFRNGKNKRERFVLHFIVLKNWRFFIVKNLFFQITYFNVCNILAPMVFQSLQKFYKMPFFFKHSNAKLKMPVIWKCFDGIQREETSDVRN